MSDGVTALDPDPDPVPVPEERLELLVPAVPESVGEVRRALATLGLPEDILDAARLLVSELVTNSVRHSGLGPDERVRVIAARSGTRLRVTVRDRPMQSESAVAGTIRPPPGAESGWGLFLVDHLATRWGTASGDEAGYWFELDAA
jgi:anti-sigma regulatory factor (Ser/Thr protein kinase)